MSPDRAERLLLELAELRATIQSAQAQRAKIVKQLPFGRTEGLTLAVYREKDTMLRNEYSGELLRRYVSPETLARCKVTRRRKGGCRMVPKAKIRTKKGTAS